MKRNIKKVADLNSRQFIEAITRHGFKFATADKTKVNVGFGHVITLEGKTLRAQLAHLLRESENAPAEQDVVADAYHKSAAEIAGGTGNLVDGAVIPSGKEHGNQNSMPTREENAARLATETAAKAPTTSTSRTCPDCGAAIPPRYRVCDNCLAKRRAAKSAAPSAPKGS